MLSPDWLSAFAPVGKLTGHDSWIAGGAGVFFLKQPLLWVITASHIVDSLGHAETSLLVTTNPGPGVAVVPVGELLRNAGLSWVVDRRSDLAAAPMPQGDNLSLKAVGEPNCLSLADTLPSMPCFSVGCPYGVRGFDSSKATPLVLDGVISGVSPQERRIYTSCPTFPGNSGGPLIAIRAPFDPRGMLTVGQPTVYLAGIMLGTATVSSPAGDPEEPPLRLGCAAPAEAISELLNSPQAAGLIAKMRQRQLLPPEE